MTTRREERKTPKGTRRDARVPEGHEREVIHKGAHLPPGEGQGESGPSTPDAARGPEK